MYIITRNKKIENVDCIRFGVSDIAQIIFKDGHYESARNNDIITIVDGNEDINAILDRVNNKYKDLPQNNDDKKGESYSEELKPIIKDRFGYLTKEEQKALCQSIAFISKNLDNYKHSPSEMVSLISGYVVWARLDIRDIIGGGLGALDYFNIIYRWD